MTLTTTTDTTCQTDGCQNRRKYADVCSTCKSREARGSNASPDNNLTLSADPLLTYARLRDVHISDAKPGETVSLRRADYIACKVFQVHPSVIWGADYWNL